MITRFLARTICVTLFILPALCRSSYGDEAKDDSVQVTGRVAHENGVPLAGALVRVAVPGVDMRQVHPGSGHRVIEGTTDADGRYELTVPLRGEKTIAVDAMKPGFGSVWETSNMQGDPPAGEVAPNTTFKASFVLKATQYAAGTVTDEQGQPVAKVEVRATLYDDSDQGWFGRTTTDERGRFELSSIPLRRSEKDRAELLFVHPPLVSAVVDDVYSLPPAEQRGMKVTLTAGHSFSGIVRDAAGNPVSRARVIVTFGEQYDLRRAVLTGDDGRFSLVGLAPKEALVRVQSLALKQHLQTSLVADRDRSDVELRLQPIVLTEPLDTIDVCGLKLATITPELRAAYFLHDEAEGVLILDPGDDSARHGIRELEEGDYFRVIGNNPCRTVRRFIDLLLKTTAAKKREPPYEILVSHTFTRLGGSFNGTYSLKFTTDDVKALQAAAVALAERPLPPAVAAMAKNARAALGVELHGGSRSNIPGVFINNVVRFSAARDAGLLGGDVITHVDETPIENRDQLIQFIRTKKPGDKVVVRVIRESPEMPRQELRLPVTLGEY
jgi:protocatechuate 3,4-dioxygenase beta subunit